MPTQTGLGLHLPLPLTQLTARWEGQTPIRNLKTGPTAPQHHHPVLTTLQEPMPHLCANAEAVTPQSRHARAAEEEVTRSQDSHLEPPFKFLTRGYVCLFFN